MKKLFAVCCVAVSFTAFAQAPAPKAAPAPAAAAAAPAAMAAMDITKVGAAARKPTDEKKSKKEIEETYKKMAAAEAKGEMTLDMHDFPLFMVTDDSMGKIEAMMVSKEDYVKMMAPMMANMPKDMKTMHKPMVSVMSDSMATVVDDFTVTSGKVKFSGRNTAMMVKVDGNWKFKSMAEAGWGQSMMPMPAETKTAPAPAAAAAPAPAAKTPASAPAPAAPSPKK